MVQWFEQRYGDNAKQTKIRELQRLIGVVQQMKQTYPQHNDVLDPILTAWVQHSQDIQQQIATQTLVQSNNNMQNVDIQKVRTAFLNSINIIRQTRWRKKYAYDERLDYSAYAWAQTLSERNQVTPTNRSSPWPHWRNTPDEWYYNYSVIDQRFRDRWVNATIINWVNHTENVSKPHFSCKQEDCTQATIDALEWTLDRFMAEESYDGAHFRSIVKKEFRYIGLWLYKDANGLWVVIHYATDLE